MIFRKTWLGLGRCPGKLEWDIGNMNLEGHYGHFNEISDTYYFAGKKRMC